MDVLNFVLRAMSWLLVNTLRLAVFTLKGLWKGGWALRRKARVAKAGTHGSARFATWRELRKGRVFGGTGLILAKRGWRFVRFNREGYALIVAKTRAGKSGCIVPTLLTAPGSVVVSDPKGENFALTGAARANIGPVYTLNVIDPIASSTFNPLDMIRGPNIDLGIHEVDDAGRLADLLVDRHGGGTGAYFEDRARALITGLLIYVTRKYAAVPELRTLAKVRSLTALGPDALPRALSDAASFGSTTLNELAASLSGGGDSRELASALATADNALKLFSADRPAGMITRSSDFNMLALNQDKASLFIMVDEEKLPIYSTFLRVVIGCALNAQTRNKAFVPKHRTTFVLDEAAAMGHIPQIEEGVGYLASYARMMLVFQDFSQIERIYPRARSIIANCGALVTFGIRDLETAKRVSEMIGNKNQLTQSAGSSQASTAMLVRNDSTGQSESGRALLDPSEVLRLPEDQVLLFMDGIRHPFKARKIRYWKEWAFRWKVGKWRAGSPPSPASSIILPPRLQNPLNVVNSDQFRQTLPIVPASRTEPDQQSL